VPERHFGCTRRDDFSLTFHGMEIRIRAAGPADLNHILRHRRAMFAEMGFRDEAVLGNVEERSREYFSEALQNGMYRAWLAEDLKGQVVAGGGIVISRWPGYPGENRAEKAWILNMYTDPAARRHGIAKRLLDVMIEWCRTRGLSMVSLHASAAGRTLYESVGFRSTNEMMLTIPLAPPGQIQ
jgi:GNAT superfamily N-acetyltransferase